MQLIAGPGPLLVAMALVVTLSSDACGGAPPAQEKAAARCFVGDPSLPPELQLLSRTIDGGGVMPIVDGDSVPLTQPPQGGKIILVGARARNLDGCSAVTSAGLMAEEGNVVVAFERRPVQLQPSGDGWLTPKQQEAAGNFSNLPACPLAGFDQRIDGQPYILQLQIDDAAGRHAEARATVVPTCTEPEVLDRCQCECAANYVLGAKCP